MAVAEVFREKSGISIKATPSTVAVVIYVQMLFSSIQNRESLTVASLSQKS